MKKNIKKIQKEKKKFNMIKSLFIFNDAFFLSLLELMKT